MYIAYIDVHNVHRSRIPMGKQPKKTRKKIGSRFNLGEPWEGRLEDFCRAHFTGSATDVIRAALAKFIPEELALDRASAERYEKYQAQRQTKRGTLSEQPPKE
jgi:hypothetical protein